jgi:hypothetical protein
MAVMQALATYRYCSLQRAAQVSSALLLQLPISDVTAGQAVILQLFASTLLLNSKLLSSFEHLTVH